MFDEAAAKMLVNEFNNMAYIFKSTKNQGRVRVPLAALVEYRGIIALVKATIRS